MIKRYIRHFRQIFTQISLFLLLLHPSLAFCISPWSTEELDKLEKEFIQIINASPQVERNPLARAYINKIGKTLGKYSHTKIPLFFIVKSGEINAFAGPGGYIGINTQLILSSDTESELAGVMAHEIAHVRLHHLYNTIAHQKQMQIPTLALLLASVALGLLNPALGSGALMASLSGVAQDSINFTRSQEKEADRIGIHTLTQAGFDPRGMSGFFRKMQEHSRYYYTAHIPAILRSHPLNEERIAEAENRTANLLQKTYPSSDEYYLVKEIVRVSTTTDFRKLASFYQESCRQQSPQFACLYGEALYSISVNHFQSAKNILQDLIQKMPDNIYFTIAMAQAETGLSDYALASERLKKNLDTNPGNYALIITLGETWMAAGQFEKAVGILLKGMRLYTQDIPLCHMLAQAQANANKQNYAYFTRGQCLMLEGKFKPAIAQLKIAQKISPKDKYLSDRIEAKIEEIKGILN